MTDHRIEVTDGDPFQIGHFRIGNRIEYDPAEHGVPLPPVPPELRERWADVTPSRWDITIGDAGGSNP